MQAFRAVPAIIAGLCLFICPRFAPAAEAEIFYDAAVKAIYEDNVIGLLPGGAGLSGGRGGTGGMMGAMGAPAMGPHSPRSTGSGPGTTSDTELYLFADLGASTEIDSGTALFLAGSAEHTSYSTFTDLNSTIGGLSAGVITKPGDILLVRVAVNGRIKRYQDSDLDSSAYGATVSLKERFTPAFWLREVYEYEKNNADSAIFTYQGNSVGIQAGFLVAPEVTLLLAYNYLVREFDEPQGFRLTANTVSAGMEYELAKKWFLDAQLAHQESEANEPGTAATDNILSVGVRYSY